MSVVDFKKTIEPTVGVESSRQRLIYCGKVLADEKKLSDYDLNGKTIHLVLKNPNSNNNPQNSSASTSSASTPGQPGNRGQPQTVYSGQWTIAWPPPGQWPPVVLRGPSVTVGQPPAHNPHQRSRSATPSTTQASSAPQQPVNPVNPVSNTPQTAPAPSGRGPVVVSSSTMTIPIAQWSLGWPLAASGPSWGPPPAPTAPPGAGWTPNVTLNGAARQRTTSGPSGQPFVPPANIVWPPPNLNLAPGQNLGMGPPPIVPNQPPGQPQQVNAGAPGQPRPAPVGAGGNVPLGTSSTGNSYLLGAFQVPQDLFDPANLTQIVQDVMSQLGVLGRNATVMSRTSEDGSAVDVHINLGQIASNLEIRRRIAVVRRLIQGLNQGLEQLDASLAALDGSGPMPPPMDIPNLNDLLNSVLGQASAAFQQPAAASGPNNQPTPTNVSSNQQTPAPQSQTLNVSSMQQTPSATTTSVSDQRTPEARNPVSDADHQSTADLLTSSVPSSTVNSNNPVDTSSSSSVGVSSTDCKQDKKEIKIDQDKQVATSSVNNNSNNNISSSIKAVTKESEDSDAEFFDADEVENMATASTGHTDGSSDGQDAAETLIGSESWHREVPSSWIPIISADIDLQRRSGRSHEPLSEAYLNVLPKKKRRTD